MEPKRQFFDDRRIIIDLGSWREDAGWEATAQTERYRTEMTERRRRHGRPNRRQNVIRTQSWKRWLKHTRSRRSIRCSSSSSAQYHRDRQRLRLHSCRLNWVICSWSAVFRQTGLNSPASSVEVIQRITTLRRYDVTNKPNLLIQPNHC